MPARKTILFITSSVEPSGGAEELWMGAAVHLSRRGHRVLAGWSEPLRDVMNYRGWQSMAAAGVEIGAFRIADFFHTIPEFLHRYSPKVAAIAYGIRQVVLSAKFRTIRPDFVVFAQWGTFDAMEWVELPLFAREIKLPYALICQKTSEDMWPVDHYRARHAGHFREARKVFFVSAHNRRLTELMLGEGIPQAEVVRNPFAISARQPLPWPESSDGIFRLACVARMYPQDKGQDLLLSVLALDKWRACPVEVSFFGKGDREGGLRATAQFLGLKNVRFAGFTHGVEEIWKAHHALVLPSRAEGLPLAQVEAMICGRVPIMGPAGGAAEILEDNVTGFLAAGPTVAALDEAMERAWQRRDDWKDIGLRASQSVWNFYPQDPCADFADKLEKLLP